LPVVSKNTARKAKKKVAAYARVSTLMEEQEESYETQRKYYEDLIQKNPEWEFAGVYADKGITGTSAVKRPDFMRMIEAAHRREIDIILCKSISRFSRNVLDTQRYVHELKSIQVEVRFEKEGISSYDTSADLIFSVLANAAEMESRSISENVKWGIRKRQEAGTYRVGSNHMLGYDEIDGKLTPNQDAWIIQLIFQEYAGGTAPRDILRILKEKGVKRMRTDQPMNWATILPLLKNEAYVGDRKLQKNPPIDVLTKKQKSNVPYAYNYVYDDHEPIVSADVWDAVQERLQRIKEQKDKGLYMRCTNHFLYGKVFCAECGEPYRRYTARGKEGLYKTWRCRGHVAGKCDSPHIRETELIDSILQQLQMEGCSADIYEWAIQESDDRVLVGGNGVRVEDYGAISIGNLQPASSSLSAAAV